jgi:hypothetical protein
MSEKTENSWTSGVLDGSLAMRKTLWPIAIGVVLLFLAATVFVVVFRTHRPSLKYNPIPPPIEELVQVREKGTLVGEWDRIEFPEAVIPVNWRKFHANGDMTVRYGDLIINGTYRFLDEQTIETTYGHDGKVQKWTFAFTKGKLIMVNYENRWIEKYKSVPPGTIRY